LTVTKQGEALIAVRDTIGVGVRDSALRARYAELANAIKATAESA